MYCTSLLVTLLVPVAFCQLPPDHPPVARYVPKSPIEGKDQARALTKIPRHDYKGDDFKDMSKVLNHWMNSSYSVRACEQWDVEELQRLQAQFYTARHPDFDSIYQTTSDNRRLRHHVFSVSGII